MNIFRTSREIELRSIFSRGTTSHLNWRQALRHCLCRIAMKTLVIWCRSGIILSGRHMAFEMISYPRIQTSITRLHSPLSWHFLFRIPAHTFALLKLLITALAFSLFFLSFALIRQIFLYFLECILCVILIKISSRISVLRWIFHIRYRDCF